MDGLRAWLLSRDEPDLRRRLFRGISLVSGILTFLVVVPVNLSQKLPWIANLGAAAFGASALGAYLAAVRGRYLFQSFFWTFLGLLSVLWFANAGSQGPTAMFFFAGAIYVLVIFEGRARWALLGLLLAHGVGLHVLERLYPDWVIPYPDPAGRFLDVLISLEVSILICVLTLGVVLANYQQDRARLERALAAVRESGERYAVTFQALPSGLGVAERESGRFLAVNEGFTDVFGFESSEVLGRTSLELGIWTDSSQRTDVIARLQAGQRVRNLPLAVRRKDGSQRWVSYAAEQIVLDGVPCLLSCGVDITELRAAEEALLESQARLVAAVDLAGLGFCEVFGDGRPAYLDARTRAILGIPPDQDRLASPIDSWSARIHSGDRERVLELNRQLDQGSLERASYEYRYLHPLGGQRWLQTLARVVARDASGRAGRSIGAFLDITERKTADEERLSLEAQVHHLQRMESVGRLAGGIAHDMNNVLAAVMGVASLLEHEGGEHAQEAQLILQACLRGRNLVKGLLEFARKEVKEAGPVDLNGLLRSEAEILASTTLRRVDVVLDLAPDLPRSFGSPTALSTAIVNLCLNALDAMPGGGTLTLRTAHLDSGEVSMVVEDTGSGMSPEVLSRAVEPFYTTKPAGKGTGLGLSLVFGTVKSHRGTLDIESQPGRGTRVEIRLPVARGDQPPDSVPPPEPVATRSLRVLLVDDDAIVRRSAAALLETLGHAVTVASGGEEALCLVEQGADWDVVLLDLNMPGLDGVQTLGRLRRVRQGLPVVLASGHLDEQLVSRLERLGAVSALPKPYSTAELQQALASAAGARSHAAGPA
jgi:PAS domain S-box-containing protein